MRTIQWRVLIPLLILATSVTSGTLALAQGESPEPQSQSQSESEAVAEEPEVDPLVEEALALWEAYEATFASIRALERQNKGKTGEEALILEEKIWSSQLRNLEVTREITADVIGLEKKGTDASELRANITKVFVAGHAGFERHFAWRDARIARLRSAREAAEGGPRIDAEKKLTAEQDRFQIALGELALTIDAMKLLGMDTQDADAELQSRLAERADYLSDRLELARKQREALSGRLKSDPDNHELAIELEAAHESFRRREQNLASSISLLGRYDVNTSEYKQTLIRSTGQLTTSVLDREVALGLFRGWLKGVGARLSERGPVWAMQTLSFVFVLTLFWLLSAIARRVVRRLVHNDGVDISNLLRDTLVAWSSKVVFAIGILVALSQVGIEIGPLLAGLGIAGFIVGFALQDSLANFAAGAMILMYRPFDVDDVIESGTVRGVVSYMSLVSTTILTFDNQTLIVPNNKIWGDVIRNVTAQSARRVDLTVRIGHEQDLERVERILYDIVAGYDKVLAEPAPVVKVNLLGEFAVELLLRPWVKREDYWDAYWDLTRAVKLRFDREGITMPKPQREVTVRQDTPD